MANTLNFYHCSERSIFNKQKISYNKNNSLYIRYDDVNTDGTYNPVLGTPDILWHSCVFIDDTKEIWCMGVFYCGGNIISPGINTGTGLNESELKNINNKIIQLLTCTRYFDIDLFAYDVKPSADKTILIPLFDYNDKSGVTYAYDVKGLCNILYGWYIICQDNHTLPYYNFYIRLNFHSLDSNFIGVTKLIRINDLIDLALINNSNYCFNRSVCSETFDLPYLTGKKAYIEFLANCDRLKVWICEDEGSGANINELTNYFIRKDVSVNNITDAMDIMYLNSSYSNITGKLAINLYGHIPDNDSYKYIPYGPTLSITQCNGVNTVISNYGILTEKIGVYQYVYKSSDADCSYGARYTEITSDELVSTNIRIPLLSGGRVIGTGTSPSEVGHTYGLTVGNYNDENPAVKLSYEGVQAKAVSVGNIKITDNVLSLATAKKTIDSSYNELCLLLLECPDGKESGKYKMSCYKKNPTELISEIELNLVKTSVGSKTQYDLFVTAPIQFRTDTNQYSDNNWFFKYMSIFVYPGYLGFFITNINKCNLINKDEYNIVIEPDDLNKEAYSLTYLGNSFSYELVANAQKNYQQIEINNITTCAPTVEFSLREISVQDDIIHYTATYDSSESGGLKRLYTNCSHKSNLYYCKINTSLLDSSVYLEVHPAQYYMNTPEKMIYCLTDGEATTDNTCKLEIEFYDGIQPGNTLELYLILPHSYNTYDIQTIISNVYDERTIINDYTLSLPEDFISYNVPVMGNYDNLISNDNINIIKNTMELTSRIVDMYKCVKITLSSVDCQLTSQPNYPYINKRFYTYKFEELGTLDSSVFKAI